ncbi:hypothetical protein JCM6882_002608 [Rhodosporidiobolus microsporus]
MAPSLPQARLAALSRSFASSSAASSPAATHHADRPLLGHLTLGDLRLPVHDPQDRERLPRGDLLLDVEDESVQREFEWLMMKWELDQDIFLLSPPGPFTRRLAQTFLSLLHTPYEIVSLHRDIGETELKQGREIREGGALEYTDGPAVRAMKEGKVLIIDGVERCERGVLPLLNNALENREMNLEDGTHLVSSARYDLMVKNGEDTTGFIPTHPNFRVIALGCPVPPFPGLPIDPPFRSRFQSRYIDPVDASKVMARQELRKLREAGTRSEEEIVTVQRFVGRMGEVVQVVQVAREMRTKIASGLSSDSTADLPLFPQTALLKIARFLSTFPPPHSESDPASSVTPSQLLSLLLVVHPTLAHAPTAAKRSLEEALKGAGFPAAWCDGISELDYAAEAARTDRGIMGWRLEKVERAKEDDRHAEVHFSRPGSRDVVVPVAAGSLPFAPFPPPSAPSLHVTPRFLHLLTSLFQLHSLQAFDIAFVPLSPTPSTSTSSSTSLVLTTFASLLGYPLSALHLYKELSGRELWMRRVVGGIGGVTGWEEAPLVKGAKGGEMVWLEGVDTIGATAGSLGRLWADREGELWEGKRLTVAPSPSGGKVEASSDGTGILDYLHPSFRIITTSTKATPPSTWLTEDLTASLLALPSIPMPPSEERALLALTSCPSPLIAQLQSFAALYRARTAAEAGSAGTSKSRRLGTASLVRIARRLARFPGENVRTLLERTLLVEFLPKVEREQVDELMKETGLEKEPTQVLPPVVVTDKALVFSTEDGSDTREIALFQLENDPAGASHVPFMDNYHDNSQQTRLMRDIAVDIELLEQHVVLLGPQGTGKNKITDRLLQLLRRPREYMQLHRDSTAAGLLFQTSLEGGVIRYKESPLLKAVKYGRVVIIDEVDKAPAPVTATLASLATRGELSLPDGRRVLPASSAHLARPDDLLVHPSFRLILLANRPGFPFLGNSFLQVLGDSFSTYALMNPDADSELRVLQQLAPDLPEALLRKLVEAFQNLRREFDKGALSYPFSLRELLALVRHLRRFPDDPLDQALRSIFDFDVHSSPTLETLRNVLRRHRLGVDKVGMDAVRGSALPVEEGKKKAKVIDFVPKGNTSLSGPKFGKTDDKEHSGGNTWAGGTGGRDTAGLGGRGGYMRLYKGGDIKQIPDALKADVPPEIAARAREMARKELADRLAQLDMSSGQASVYSRYHDAVAAHVHQLVSFLENLEAKEEERVWLKRQSDGELDESRISEGLTGEATVYKRRGFEKPELGRPQLKPKRIRFIFDVSASMYRNQHDGRLARSLEAAIMIMEAFDRLSAAGKQKYLVDIIGHSGEEAEIKLVEAGKLPTDAGERFKTVEKMATISQFCWPGDETIHSLEKGVDHVAEADADDYFLIALTDANFSRYSISVEDVRRALTRNPKVRASLIAIGEGAESEELPKALPGKVFRVRETAEIATTLRSILGTYLGGL